MGMFDDIEGVPVIPCMKCGKPIDGGWQSKDADCQMDKIPFWHVRNFYTFCRDCRTWHEFRLKAPYAIRPFSDYELIGFPVDGEAAK